MFAFDMIVAVVAMSQAPEAPQAPPAPSAQPQQQVEVVAPTPRRVCRMVPQRGSHLTGRRVCQTVEEREQEVEETQRMWEDALTNTLDRQRGTGYVQGGNSVSARRGFISRCGLRGPC